MKNLKKVLALVLAFACAFTMFAGAAFTDQADISDVNADAVELLTTLNIIQGDPDGSFAPEREVTRAEMAKMIYTIRNNGNDDASAYETVTTSFKDIAGHWAEGYIKYLQNTGIVAGKSATEFDPDSTVTTGEAMKMALVLGGYRADKAELTGAKWLNNTVSLATTNGLTTNVGSAIAGGCTRQDAAQILSNALGMTAVQWSEITSSFLNDSEDGLAFGGAAISVGRKWMDLYTNIGTLVAIDGTDLDIQMSASDVKDSDTEDEHFISVGTDYSSLLGQKVKVLFSSGKNNSVIGLFAIDDNNLVIVNQNVIGVDAGKLVIDGTSYAIEGDGVTVVQDGQELDTKWKAGEFKNEQSANVVSLIDTDGNNKIDAAYIKTVNVQKVSYVASSQIIAGSKTYKFADDSIDENVAKDDWVMITKNLYNDNNDIVVVEKATGAVQATKTGTYKKYQIGDTWYNETDSSAKDINTNVKPGVDAEYVAVNGILFYAVKTSAGADKLTDVLFVAYRGQDGLSSDQARVMFPNGDKATVDLKSKYVYNQNGQETRTEVAAGNFYEYSKSGSTYELIELSYEADFYGNFTARVPGAMNAANDTVSYRDAAGVAGNKTIADSADVIVWTMVGDDVDFKHITGKQLKTLIDQIGIGDANGQFTANTLGVFTSGVDGLNRASVLAVEYNSADGTLGNEFNNISSNANYGFITVDAVKLSNGNIKFTVWTGSENVEVIAEKSNETQFTKGTIVGYTEIVDNEDGTKTMTDANAIRAFTPIVRALNTADGVYIGAITAVNTAGTKIETNIPGAAEVDLTAYGTVLYVDSKAGTGLTDGTPTVANSQKAGGVTYYASNILLYGEEVAVIDVNEIAGSTYGTFDLPDLSGLGLSDVQWLNTRTNDTDEGAAYEGAILQLSFYAETAGTLKLENMQSVDAQYNKAGYVELPYKAGYNKFDSLIVDGTGNVTSDGETQETGSNSGTGTYTVFMPNAVTAAGYTATVTVADKDRVVNVKTGDTFTFKVTLDKVVTAGKSVTVTITDGKLVGSPVSFVIPEGQTSVTKQVSLIVNADGQLNNPTVAEVAATYDTIFTNNNFEVTGLAGTDKYTVVLENTTTATDKNVAGKTQTITAKLAKNGTVLAADTDYDTFTGDKAISVALSAKDADGEVVALATSPITFNQDTAATGVTFTFTMPTSNASITIDSAKTAKAEYTLALADNLKTAASLESLGYTGETDKDSELTVTLDPTAGNKSEGTNVKVTAAINTISANNYIKVTLTAGDEELVYNLNSTTKTADKVFTLTGNTTVSLKSIEIPATPKITAVKLVDQNDQLIVSGGSYATTDKLIVTFDTAMDTSVTTATQLFTVGGTGTGALSAGSWSDDGKTLTFTTSTAVAANDTLTPATTLVSADGVPVNAAQVITINAAGTAPTFVQ